MDFHFVVMFIDCSSGCNSGLGCLLIVVVAVIVNWDGLPLCCDVY